MGNRVEMVVTTDCYLIEILRRFQSHSQHLQTASDARAVAAANEVCSLPPRLDRHFSASSNQCSNCFTAHGHTQAAQVSWVASIVAHTREKLSHLFWNLFLQRVAYDRSLSVTAQKYLLGDFFEQVLCLCSSLLQTWIDAVSPKGRGVWVTVAFIDVVVAAVYGLLLIVWIMRRVGWQTIGAN